MNIIFVDVECTNLDPWSGELLTLYAIKVQDFAKVDERLFKFKPETWLDRYNPSVAIHGITKEEANNYPDKYESLLEFLVWCGEGNLFFCHANKLNGYAFDYAVIEKEMSLFDLQWEFRKAFYPLIGYSTHTLCYLADLKGLINVPSTIKEGNKRASKSFGLKELCKILNIPLENHHDAKIDCEACFNIFMKIYNKNPVWVIDNIKNGLTTIIGDQNGISKTSRF